MTDSQTAIGLEIQNVSRTFDGNVIALAPTNLTIFPGEFVAILGPSGCGKSTLLRLIAHLDRPSTGSILHLSGRAGIPARLGEATPEPDHDRRSIAYVFQDAHLLPWRNVLRNVCLPLELIGVKKSAAKDTALRALKEVGLADAIKRYPAQLSGGMKMRVSLARALVTQPKLLLLDEPFAALDEITRQHLDEKLRELWATHRMTTIFVTHSTSEAAFLANRAVVLSKRPGKVIFDQPINLPETRTADLRGEPEFAAVTRQIFRALESGEKP